MTHVHDWERGVHMNEAFGVDGRLLACAICGVYKPEPDTAPRTDLIAIRDRDAEWRDVADDPLLTPLHLDQHEGATHIERRSCAKAAIVDRRTLLRLIDEAEPVVPELTAERLAEAVKRLPYAKAGLFPLVTGDEDWTDVMQDGTRWSREDLALELGEALVAALRGGPDDPAARPLTERPETPWTMQKPTPKSRRHS